MKRRRPATKVIVDSTGKVYLRRASGFHNPIGRVVKMPTGWGACGVPNYHCALKKTKHQAVLFVVKRWQSYVGTGRKLDY